jgi:predicted transcriptional regulator
MKKYPDEVNNSVEIKYVQNLFKNKESDIKIQKSQNYDINVLSKDDKFNFFKEKIDETDSLEEAKNALRPFKSTLQSSSKEISNALLDYLNYKFADQVNTEETQDQETTQ